MAPPTIATPVACPIGSAVGTMAFVAGSMRVMARPPQPELVTQTEVSSAARSPQTPVPTEMLAVTVFVFDRRAYVIISSGQVRVCLAVGAGEVLVSATVRDLVVGSGLEFDERGEHEHEDQSTA